MTSVEMILSGALGFTILSTMIIIFYIIRNYNLIESHKDSTDKLRHDIESLAEEMREIKKKG